MRNSSANVVSRNAGVVVRNFSAAPLYLVQKAEANCQRIYRAAGIRLIWINSVEDVTWEGPDVVFRAVILPEAGIEQAQQLFGRLQGAISGRPLGQAGRLHLSAGVAELRPDDDSISFFERADQALYRAKDAGKGRAFTADGHAA